MKQDTIAYLKSQKPQVDVLGRWVYLPNARTGSTSITGGLLADRAVMHHRGEENWDRVWEKIVAPNIDDAVIFTFVRNPWDRAVSVWRFLQEKGRVSKAESFPEFMGNGAFGKKYDHFLRPQSASFMQEGIVIPEVFVAKHESRQEDWWKIASQIGIAAPLPHRNATEHEPYWDYYDMETVELVNRTYATEIYSLGYEFGK